MQSNSINSISGIVNEYWVSFWMTLFTSSYYIYQNQTPDHQHSAEWDESVDGKEEGGSMSDCSEFIYTVCLHHDLSSHKCMLLNIMSQLLYSINWNNKDE